ncbi:SGNH/GDSL hydrolase family protein [Nitrospirillum iridis]|uniref:Lysophospholipase L1-like esterase n=1 Tax=Nitrospirillum iridis TaxID=765888 RepID=A0A7X0AX55_9PROT|nr:SGNH/GDSL hydrolase family protein [Nitrospirillum iridis]MBB6250296.1 lysophospholipase L1-like esterase [Nitrospirillum iridis]
MRRGMWRMVGCGVAAGLVMGTAGAEELAALRPHAVILFQGDSITEGGRQPGNDLNHTMGQDYDYIIAAEVGAQYPERRLTFLNRGISGNTVTDLAARWQADVIDLKPDLLSILVGVNDTFHGKGETVEDYARTYERLIQQTQAQLPGTRIILGQPFLLPAGDYQADYPAKRAQVKLRQAVVADLAAKYHLPLIRYQEAFDEACRKAPADHWSWDGIHPTYAGHGLMAREWRRAVDAAWPPG